MAEEFGRLVLRQDVKTESGGSSKELVIYRPSAKDLLELADINKPADQVRHFAKTCCKAVNGGAPGEDFKANELDASDAAELSALAGSIYREFIDYELPEDAGDGVTQPIIYTLRKPITLNRGPEDPEPEVVRQIEFQARRLGEISEFLDARAGTAEEFYVFMRTFGHLMGTRLPMSTVIIQTMDYQDYLIIRTKIMGKLARSGGRWKRTLN